MRATGQAHQAAAAVRDAEGLVQVEVADVGAGIARPTITRRSCSRRRDGQASVFLHRR
jgi:hypothetical protein